MSTTQSGVMSMAICRTTDPCIATCAGLFASFSPASITKTRWRLAAAPGTTSACSRAHARPRAPPAPAPLALPAVVRPHHARTGLAAVCPLPPELLAPRRPADHPRDRRLSSAAHSPILDGRARAIDDTVTCQRLDVGVGDVDLIEVAQHGRPPGTVQVAGRLAERDVPHRLLHLVEAEPRAHRRGAREAHVELKRHRRS